MIVTKNENIVYVDVDDTLCYFSSIGYYANFYGQKKVITPLDKNIDFMKSLKARGWYVIVHSANGWAWAEEVIKTLKLEEYVDEVKTKSNKYVDDTPVEQWFGPRIYFND